jgi:hypothetical protein
MSRRVELTVAVASFAAAVAFAFASLAISEAHEVAAGNCSVIAQFLLLTASIFGIDYKFSNRSDHVSTNVRSHKQPPAA